MITPTVVYVFMLGLFRVINETKIMPPVQNNL
jgi:hypothetical protein